MKADWKSFLANNGAEFNATDGISIESFGNPIREQRMALGGNIMCDLSDVGLIEVFGDDARTFLQGQTSNNMDEVNTETSRLGSYCTPKGRVLSTFRTFQRSDSESIYLSLAQDLVPAVLKRLRMFVMMSKVTLEDANDALVRFGVSGPTADEELTNYLGSCPTSTDACEQINNHTVIRLAGETPRFEVYGYLEDMTKLWSQLNMNCAPVGKEAWSLLSIQEGTPQVVESSTELFVPQMINLQLIEAVSFHKGCFPGQEVVARMHYLGKLKRRMYVVRLNTNDAPAEGSKLVSQEGESLVAAGNIVNATLHPDGGVVALAVLISKFVESEAIIQLESDDSATISSIAPPPYGFEVDEPEVSQTVN